MSDDAITDTTDDAMTAVDIDDDIAAALCEAFPGSVFVRSHGQPVVYIDRDHWHDAAQHCKDDADMTSCMDITAVDHLANAERVVPAGIVGERFEVVANFLSHRRNRRIRLIAQVPAADASIASITDVYPGLNFAEREAFDLMGVRFDGHPDLTRILMPEGWDGHPLRKDAPGARVPVTFKEDPTPR